MLACLAVSGYITNDYINKLSFLSCERPIDENVAKLIKQAAVRSLSCEVVPDKEGQMYFGDEKRGHVLSHTFFLQDSQARGFNRWYSVVVFMRDKHFLINSWFFFQNHITQLVNQLQNRAAEVYNEEQKVRPQRALRLSEGDQKAGGNKTARPITELTASPQLFAQIHLWFTWLLSIGAKRLEEQIPTRALDSELLQKNEEDGFIIVDGVNNKELKDNSPQHSAVTIYYLRQFSSALGPGKLKSLIYGLMIGRQVVIRGPQRLVQFVIHLLRFLLPPRKFHCLEYAEQYVGPEKVNVIGLNIFAAAPVASSTIERIDIVPTASLDTETAISDLGLEHFQYTAKSVSDLPKKIPTLLCGVFGHLLNPAISDQLAFFLISGLIKKWMHIAGVVNEAKMVSEGQEVTGLLQSLGAHPHDEILLDFWSSSRVVTSKSN